MSHKAWNDLSPLEPLVARGRQTLVVAAVPPLQRGMRPKVMLRVGEETDSQSMQLTPSEARTVAIALLQAAEKAEGQTQTAHSN
jgi:hypothetical protein